MHKHIVFTVFLLFLSGVTIAQNNPLLINKVDSMLAKEAKPILILLSTDWCTYCQMQKKQIQKNPNFQQNDFYYVEFDAESKEHVHLGNQTFDFNPVAKLHEVAIALNGSEKITFPTWVLLDPDYQPLFKHNGALLPDQINELVMVLKDNFIAK